MADSEAQPLSQPEVDAISVKGDAQINAPEPQNNPPLVPESLPSPRDTKLSCACRPDQTPTWKITLEIMAVVVGIAAVVIYGWQLWVMHQTLTEMKRSGEQSTEQAWSAVGNINWMARSMDLSQKEAQDSLQATIDSFHLDQRAWVGLTDIQCSDCGTYVNFPPHNSPTSLVPSGAWDAMFSVKGLEASVINTGRTPADDVHVFYTFHIGRSLDLEKCNNPSTMNVCTRSPYDLRNFFETEHDSSRDRKGLGPSNIGVVVPGATKPLILKSANLYKEIGPPPANAVDTYWPSLYVDGSITYKTFGEIGETRFCFFVYPAEHIRTPLGEERDIHYQYCDTPESNTMR